MVDTKRYDVIRFNIVITFRCPCYMSESNKQLQTKTIKLHRGTNTTSRMWQRREREGLGTQVKEGTNKQGDGCLQLPCFIDDIQSMALHLSQSCLCRWLPVLRLSGDGAGGVRWQWRMWGDNCRWIKGGGTGKSAAETVFATKSMNCLDKRCQGFLFKDSICSVVYRATVLFSSFTFRKHNNCQPPWLWRC